MIDNPRFVKVTIFNGAHGHPCWGLGDRAVFMPLWCAPERRGIIEFELGNFNYLLTVNGNGLTTNEANSMVDANITNTPPEAWAALAYYRMTGKIAPELCEPDLTKAPTNEEHT